MRRFALIPLVLIVMFMAACSSSEDVNTARAAATDFHTQLDAGQFDQIWQASSDDLKQASSQKDFTDLLDAVHRKLGKVSSSDEAHWGIKMLTSGTFVDLVYKTHFEGGSAVEQFDWRIDDSGKALLVGYHINSNALIIKDDKH